MIWIVCMMASAADVFPGVFNPSAVPMDEGQALQVEVSGSAAQWDQRVFSRTEHTVAIVGTNSAWDLSDRVRLTANVHGRRWSQSGTRGGACLLGGRCGESQPYTTTGTGVSGTVGASYRWLSTPQWTARVYGRMGTLAQVGVALHWRSIEERWAVDASWGPALPVNPAAYDVGVSEVESASFMHVLYPEAGLTWHPRPGANHAVRLGMTSWAPTITAHVASERVYVDTTVAPVFSSILGFGMAGQLAVGATL